MALKMRVDKWLWTIRIFKSRTLSTDTCKSGKVKVNGKDVKPSAEVVIGDTVEVKKDGFMMQYRVRDIVPSRVSAVLAAPCYENITPEEELKKYDVWFLAKSGTEYRERGTGRPTKRDRRELDGFKDDDDDDDDE
jgi:ribosome-associated heat shock protein Hsp15